MDVRTPALENCDVESAENVYEKIGIDKGNPELEPKRAQNTE